MDLSKEMRQEERTTSTSTSTSTTHNGKKQATQKPTRGRGRPPGGGVTSSKGQAKLAFGRRG
jgi:DNA polymerase eta